MHHCGRKFFRFRSSKQKGQREAADSESDSSFPKMFGKGFRSHTMTPTPASRAMIHENIAMEEPFVHPEVFYALDVIWFVISSYSSRSLLSKRP